MKRKLIFIFPFMLLCFMLLSAHAFAMSDSDIEIKVASPVNGLISESGVVAVEHFPAEITVITTAKTGNLTGIQAAFNGKTQGIEQKHVIIIQNKEDCGIYTITVRSMSRKGNCWDNACAETFFSTIKSERLYHRKYRNFEEARKDIFWYIECFYNRKRRHAALGNLTPEAFLKTYNTKREDGSVYAAKAS